MATQRNALIAYDIHRSSSRSRVRRALLPWRIDGQLSVHECLLSGAEASALLVHLDTLLDDSTDTLLLSWVTPARPSPNLHTAFPTLKMFS